jgi:hypothetical protein
VLDHLPTQVLVNDCVVAVGVETDELSVTSKPEVHRGCLGQGLNLCVKTHSEGEHLGPLDVDLAVEVDRDIESIKA